MEVASYLGVYSSMFVHRYSQIIVVDGKQTYIAYRKIQRMELDKKLQHSMICQTIIQGNTAYDDKQENISYNDTPENNTRKYSTK